MLFYSGQNSLLSLCFGIHKRDHRETEPRKPIAPKRKQRHFKPVPSDSACPLFSAKAKLSALVQSNYWDWEGDTKLQKTQAKFLLFSNGFSEAEGRDAHKPAGTECGDTTGNVLSCGILIQLVCSKNRVKMRG